MSLLAALRQSARASIRATSSARVVARHPQRLSPFVRTIVTKKFTPEHEAVVYDDEKNIGTVYITDYAQKSLGDVVFVELPAVGTKVASGEQMGAVESVKAASDIYAPVSGTIKEVNEALGENPGLINKSPEDEAWLCKIELSESSEISKLLDEKAYLEHCEA